MGVDVGDEALCSWLFPYNEEKDEFQKRDLKDIELIIQHTLIARLHAARLLKTRSASAHPSRSALSIVF